MWKFALVLAVVHGASCDVPNAHWVLGTLKCSKLRVVVKPNKNLVETPEELDQLCKQQTEFYHCLEKLLSLQNLGTVTEEDFPSKMKMERSVLNSLCSQDSTWRKSYLEFAPCINMQQTDFCMTPEFLGADDGDQDDCDIQEKMENCIAATLSMKCSIEAGQLFHHLMKLKGDDVCQPEIITTYTDSEPTCNGYSTESVFHEVYDQLVKKMGHIPEQDYAESFVLHKRVGDTHDESLESVDENVSSSSDIENFDQYSRFTNAEDSFENMEHTVTEGYSMPEVKLSTSDDVDKTEDLPEIPEIFYYFHYYGRKMKEVLKLRDVLKERMAFTLKSAIKARFRSMRNLSTRENYETVRIFPDGRINYYSRRRDIQDLEYIKCYNFPDYFVCINIPRTDYPECLESTIFTGSREGEFFPEEFDPEFGAQWYETIPNEPYLFEPWVHESIEDTSDSVPYTSVTDDTEASYVPVDKGSEDRVELLKDVEADTHIVSKGLPFSVMKDSESYEFTTKENKAETLMKLFKIFTASLPSTSRTEIKNLIPKSVKEALANLYGNKRMSLGNVKMRFDSLGNLYIFWNNQQESVINTITCGKVNDCHPKGEGIWKCVIVPRPGPETVSSEAVR